MGLDQELYVLPKDKLEELKSILKVDSGGEDMCNFLDSLKHLDEWRKNYRVHDYFLDLTSIVYSNFQMGQDIVVVSGPKLIVTNYNDDDFYEINDNEYFLYITSW